MEVLGTSIDYGNGFGEADHPLMRSSEAYLIAAEAIVKGASNGSVGSASDYYNAVVNRAVGGALADADMAALRAMRPRYSCPLWRCSAGSEVWVRTSDSAHGVLQGT